jgi:hypothetical protein
MQAATDADAASTERATPHTVCPTEVSPAPTLESNPQPDPMQLNCSVVITVIDCLMSGRRRTERQITDAR